MALAVIQIGDIHLRGVEDEILKRSEAIGSAIRSRLASGDTLLLIITGDVAFSGELQQYDVALGFFDRILTPVRDSGVKVLTKISVPGNHDCNFSKEGDARRVLIKSVPDQISKLSLSGDIAGQIVGVQEEFFEFESRFCGCSKLTGADRFFWSRVFNHGDRSVRVKCFNTAWMSQLQETQGQLFVPTAVLDSVPPSSQEEIVIAAFHHPYRWIESTNGREFGRIVEATSDVVLTGHEHAGDFYRKERQNQASASFVEGGALNDPALPSEFVMITVDFKTHYQHVIRFEWKSDLYAPSEEFESPFVRNPALVAERFENNDAFQRYLDDPGTGYIHPHKTNLALSDIFVYPDMRLRTLDQKVPIPISSDQLTSFVAQKNRLLITGAELSGKTSLAKTLLRDLKQKFDVIPILLNGRNMKGTSKKAIDKTIRDAYENQYSPNTYEKFLQIPPERKALIIDDWHKANFNTAGRLAFSDEVRSRFGKTVYFTAELFILPEIIAGMGDGEEANYCEIKEFGYYLRDQLITKWHKLGREFTVDEGELTHDISVATSRVDTLIVRGKMPAHAFYVLSVLQVPHPASASNVSYGSYGYIYNSLITSKLHLITKKSTEIGTWYAYLSLLAHALFRSGKYALSRSEMTDVHFSYNSTYGRSLDFESAVRELLDAQILSQDGDEFSFKYEYYYFFFVAKYFQEALANDPNSGEIRAELQNLSDMVSFDEYSNILAFYVYLSKDRKLIEHILSNAKQIFIDKPPANFIDEVRFLDNLSLPALEEPSTDTGYNREKFLRSKDKIGEELENARDKKGPDRRVKYIETLDVSIKIDFAINSMDLMRQILRNFPGDLRRDLKLKLSAEAFELGLRTARAAFDGFATDIDDIRSSLVKMLQMHQAYKGQSDSKIRQSADELLQMLTVTIAYGIVKKVSSATGLEDLEETYKELRNQYGEDNVAMRLIDLAIRLDHFSKFPNADVRDLEGRLRKNPFVLMILRFLIFDYLYLFPVDRRRRQQLSSLFQFKSSIPELITGRHKKTKPPRN